MASKWAARISAVRSAVYSRGGITADVRDLQEVQRTFEAMGKLPQRVVTGAAGKAATAVRRAVKSSSEIPVDTGTLRGAIIRKGERSRYKGKKVYEVVFDPALNSVLQKPIKHPGEAHGKSKHGYYPASMEYGFLTRSKGGGISYFPGFHFMRDTGEAQRGKAREIMASELNKRMEKEWRKRHGS